MKICQVLWWLSVQAFTQAVITDEIDKNVLVSIFMI